MRSIPFTRYISLSLSLSLYIYIYIYVFHFSLSALVSLSLSLSSDWPNDSIFFSSCSFQFVLKPITPFSFLGLCSLYLKTQTPIFFFVLVFVVCPKTQRWSIDEEDDEGDKSCGDNDDGPMFNEVDDYIL